MNEANDSKFVTRKWNIVNDQYDQSKSNYGAANETNYNTEALKSNLCDYNDPYILVRRNITITGHYLATQVAFTKIDGTTIDDAEDLDLVISMYNLLEYCSKYSETTGRLWFY